MKSSKYRLFSKGVTLALIVLVFGFSLILWLTSPLTTVTTTGRMENLLLLNAIVYVIIPAILIIAGWLNIRQNAESCQQNAEFAELDLSLKLHKFCLEKAIDGVFWVNSKAQFVYVNEAACSSLGYTREQLLSMTIPEIYPVYPLVSWPTIWQKIKENKSLVFETYHRRQDGQILPVELAANYCNCNEQEYICTFSRDLSKRKETEAKLRESEEKYGFLSENTPVILHSLDENGKIISVSNYWLKKLGYGRSEVIGRKFSEFLTEASATYTQEVILSEYGQTGIYQDIPCQWLKKNGEIIDVLVSAIAERDAEGKIIRSLAVLRDVTEQKQAEKALRESKELYRSVITAMAEGIVVHQADGQIIACNPSAEKILGLTQAQIMGKTSLDPYWQTIHEDGSPFPGKEHPATITLETGIPLSQIVMGIQQANFPKITWIAINSQPLFPENSSKPSGVVVSFSNITNYKEAQEILKTNEQRLSLALDAAKAGIWELNMQTNEAFWSEENFRLLGYEPGSVEANYHSWLNRVHPEDKSIVEPYFQKVLRGKTNLNLEYRVLLANNNVRWLKNIGKIIYNRQGKPQSMIGIQLDITDKKQTEEALRWSEARYRAILQDQTELICRYLPGGILTFVNDAYCRYFSKTQEELLGNTFFPLVPAEDRAKIQASIDCLSSENPFSTLEHRVIKGNGEIAWQQWNNRAICNDQGKIIEFQAVGRDISDRKQTEEKLTQISKAVASASDAICITDLDFNSLYHNQAFADIFGYTPENLNCAGKLSILFPDANLRERVFQEISQGNSWDGELTMYRQSSAKILALLRADAIQDEEKNILGFVFIFTDITERKQTEIALWETQRLLQTIAEHTPNHIYLYDLSQECLIYVNRQVEKFYGYSCNQIRAMGWKFFLKVLHRDYRSQLTQQSAKYALAKDFDVLENEFMSKNHQGEWRWLHSWEIIFTRNKQGKPQQILATAIDITEQKQAVNILIALEKEQEINLWQRQFFSMVSHEFRTPLSTILMSTQILNNLSKKLDNDKLNRNLQRIQKSVKRSLALLDDIMTISRAEMNQYELHYRPIIIDNFCHKILQELKRNYLNLQQISYQKKGERQQIVSDEKILYSIIYNLLANAVKYSPDQRKINFTINCNLPQVILEVEDEGIGIAPEDIPKLFEPFYRGQNVGLLPGSGLGLTILKKYVDLLAGDIKVESKLGIGTKFTITFESR